MLTPPDVTTARDGAEILFVRRWNTLVSVLLCDPSVKLVARTVVDYGLADGAGVYPGNQLIARQTGLSDRAVKQAWHALRALGMAELVTPSYYDGKRRLADEYQLVIPAAWHLFAVYGPNLRRFTCQYCGRVFNPKPCLNAHPDGTIGWKLARAAFCPEPRHGRGCYVEWDIQRKRHRQPMWGELGDDCWKMFRLARGDDWPAPDVKRSAGDVWDS